MRPQNNPLDQHLTLSSTEKGYYPKYWYLLTFASTLALGVGSVYLFPYLYGKWMVEAAPIVQLVLALINVVWFFIISATKRKSYVQVYSWNTVLIWLGFFVGWVLINNNYFEDLLVFNGAGALLGIGIGRLLFGYQNKHEFK